MKIRKILLRDNCDHFFTDLIEFERDTTLEEINKVINKCCNEDLVGEYTNEDIYNYLDAGIGIKNIEFLDYEIVEY